MKQRSYIFWLLFLFALVPIARCAETLAPRTFSHPDRIRYDSQCLTIDGRDVFIYSGAFHYFRCPKELWRDRFQKIKDAGFNCVETYVPWNYCEQQMPAGTNDFSKVDLKDFDDWLTMAGQFGFYVIVRPGPYICAEWDTGGFPQWLLTKKPSPLKTTDWLRSDDPVYLAWCKHWYDAVCPVIARHQITRKSPGAAGVILVQVENEYDFPKLPDAVKINQVKALAGFARADGIDVPLISCWTHQVRGSTDPVLRQIFDCCNFYPRWNVDGIQNDIGKLRREQPDAPLATTELQGGWFSQVGGKLSEDQDGVTASQINNLTLFAIQNGESILNYYMLFGGSNPGDWAARNLTTSYDYNAPIREWGGVGDRYQRVWAIGHMLQKFGTKLARSKAVDCDATTSQKDVTVVERRAPDGSRFLFVRTSQHAEPREGTARVKEKNSGAPEIVFNYQLEPFGSKIFYLPPGTTNVAHGEWLPKAAPKIERPADLPASVTITSARSHGDSGPAHWMKLKVQGNLAQAGIDDSHFLFYRAKIYSAAATNLLVEFPSGDAVLAAINGRPLTIINSASGETVFSLPAGSNDLQLLYENHGHANGGSDMENPSGILSAQFVSETQASGKPISGWRMKKVDNADDRPEIKSDFDDRGWTPVQTDRLEANQLQSGETAVFRATVDVTADDLKNANWNLTFGRIDDSGWIYVNGKKTGRAADWSRACSFNVTPQLHPGANSIAVIVNNDGGGGGLGLPVFGRAQKSAFVPLKFLGRPAGDEARWWKPDFNDKHWTVTAIGSNPPQKNLLTWYRMNFQLQPANPGVWVPWRLHLVANGNGFLYLNGHAIGRYWRAGPQHDFFLPECWLNFGGATNSLTLNLRPMDGAAAIQSAVVEPYAGFQEKR